MTVEHTYGSCVHCFTGNSSAIEIASWVESCRPEKTVYLPDVNHFVRWLSVSIPWQVTTNRGHMLSVIRGPWLEASHLPGVSLQWFVKHNTFMYLKTFKCLQSFQLLLKPAYILCAWKPGMFQRYKTEQCWKFYKVPPFLWGWGGYPVHRGWGSKSGRTLGPSAIYEISGGISGLSSLFPSEVYHSAASPSWHWISH